MLDISQIEKKKIEWTIHFHLRKPSSELALSVEMLLRFGQYVVKNWILYGGFMSQRNDGRD